MARPARLALLLALLLAGCGTLQPPRLERTLPSVPAPSAAASASVPPSALASPVQSVAASPASASPASAARPGAVVPKQLLIPAIGVTAPVERVGLTADGAMAVPRDWNDVGWFERGFRPGERGSAVIAGHLDSPTDRAIFWDLHRLKPGDKVLVKGEDGSERTFEVIRSETYPYNEAPLERIFGPSDVPMLNLVTCNGTFDRGSRNYDKRLVVFTREVA